MNYSESHEYVLIGGVKHPVIHPKSPKKKKPRKTSSYDIFDFNKTRKKIGF